MSKKKFIDNLSQDALEDLSILATNIAEARKIRGFSQKDMAERCLMAFSTYQAIEHASPTVSIGAILSVLDILDMSDGLRNVAAPHLDPTGSSIRAEKRRRKP